MTISHQASTGTPAASAQGTTSISVAYPAAVAAGRIAILVAAVKLSTATWGTVTGFTLVGERAGGTGASAADAGTTRVGVWYRILTGGESGSVTVPNTGGGSAAGAMSIYSGTLGGWIAPAFVAGSDTTHGTNWSAACGAWGATLAANDWLVVANSTDTDTAQTISAATITQTGATFGARTLRNRSLSTSGNDSGAYSWDASVSTGSANAPTWTHTSATSTCGATLVVRLREQPNVNGAGLGAFTVGVTASGIPGVSGAAAAACSFSGTASGNVAAGGVSGAGLGALTFAGTAQGVDGAVGVGVAAPGFGSTAQGLVGHVGQAAATFAVTATGAAIPGVVGSTATALAFTGAAGGGRGVDGQGLAGISFTGAAAGEATGPGAEVSGTAFGAFTFAATVVISTGSDPPIVAATMPAALPAAALQPLVVSAAVVLPLVSHGGGR